jgi:hypothetical protein
MMEITWPRQKPRCLPLRQQHDRLANLCRLPWQVRLLRRGLGIGQGRGSLLRKFLCVRGDSVINVAQHYTLAIVASVTESQ